MGAGMVAIAKPNLSNGSLMFRAHTFRRGGRKMRPVARSTARCGSAAMATVEGIFGLV